MLSYVYLQWTSITINFHESPHYNDFSACRQRMAQDHHLHLLRLQPRAAHGGAQGEGGQFRRGDLRESWLIKKKSGTDT